MCNYHYKSFKRRLRKLLQYSFAVWLQCPSSLGPGEFSICVLGPKSGSGLEREKILWHSLGATAPWLLIFPPWLLIICIDSAVPIMAPYLFHSDENFALWTISIILSGSSPLDDFYHLATHFDNWAHLTSDKQALLPALYSLGVLLYPLFLVVWLSNGIVYHETWPTGVISLNLETVTLSPAHPLLLLQIIYPVGPTIKYCPLVLDVYPL